MFGFLPTVRFKNEKEYFVENLRILLMSGTDITSALDVIRKGVATPRMLALLLKIEDDIGAGMRVSQALSRAGLLSPREAALLHIGEESGKVSESLDLIVRQDEKQDQFKSRIQSALLYPVIIFSATLILGVFISWFILPKLAGVFAGLSLELPLITRVLIKSGIFMQQYGIIAAPLFLVSFSLLVYFLFFFSRTKHIGESLIFAVPFIRKLIREAEVARFGYFLGTLLNAGIPLVVSLDLLTDATTFRAYKKLYHHLSESTQSGQFLSEGFREYRGSERLIPQPVQYLIGSALQSGKLAETLLKVGERFEAKTEVTTKNLSVLIEPILLIIVWAGVMLIALAVIVPLYGLIGNLSGR